MPDGTDLTSLVASFESNADRVCIGSKEQSSGVTPNDFSSKVKYTLYSDFGLNRIYVKVYDFDLPTVWLATEDGSDITSKEVWKENAEIRIYDNEDGTITDLYTTDVKGRGNMSWGGAKKPYTIKLSEKKSILGMPKDKRWNFLANYHDQSDIRNDIALELARRSPGLAWNSRGEFVELILNGEHKGNYYLCEHIKIAKDRVNINEIDEDDEVAARAAGTSFDRTGGYLLEFDSYYDETLKFRTKLKDLPVNLKSPDWSGFPLTYVQSWIDTLETKLQNAATSDYKDYLDIDSYIDYWFVYEMVQNPELNHPKSAYMFKDRDVNPKTDSKIHAGPVWDFDLSLLSSTQYDVGWWAKGTLWYGYLFNDSDFVARAKQKWNEQKSIYEDVAVNYIDDLAAKVRTSVIRDKEIWGYESSYDAGLTFDQIVDKLKTTLQNRINWMDSQITNW